jgi:hypothetical protein
MLQYIQEQRGSGIIRRSFPSRGKPRRSALSPRGCETTVFTEEQVASWRKGHTFKPKLAVKLRAETTVKASWIAHSLAMENRGHLAHLLYRNDQTLPRALKSILPGLNIS